MTDTKIKILVAEDDSLIARDIQKTLEGNGYQVISVVDNAKDAISMTSAKKPDLIVMDIMLKGKLTGINAAEEINKLQQIPIIFISALSDDETFLNAYMTRPFAYINKPFRHKDLLERIGNVFKLQVR